MAMINPIKAITSMTPDITTPATSPACGPCPPHSESVESVPGFIRFSPTDSHLRWEGPDNRFSSGCVVYILSSGEDSRPGVWLLVQRYWVQSPMSTWSISRPSARFLSDGVSPLYSTGSARFGWVPCPLQPGFSLGGVSVSDDALVLSQWRNNTHTSLAFHFYIIIAYHIFGLISLKCI